MNTPILQADFKIDFEDGFTNPNARLYRIPTQPDLGDRNRSDVDISADDWYQSPDFMRDLVADLNLSDLVSIRDVSLGEDPGSVMIYIYSGQDWDEVHEFVSEVVNHLLMEWLDESKDDEDVTYCDYDPRYDSTDYDDNNEYYDKYNPYL